MFFFHQTPGDPEERELWYQSSRATQLPSKELSQQCFMGFTVKSEFFSQKGLHWKVENLINLKLCSKL